ncbi:helix-turn-helix transcriptional regulator [Diaminobutyricibacter tongyongensis]|uniref:Helix-turn-helix transcriptional regulator n=1 Tax=Leifsonia tongyongensis TaxID=1268043 RepID=A0A6L9Y2U5_9MICO|nr:helix-turn-helix transcriptional regulator [Diaminobutyricibacter tongyongensis]NEN07608.1 helix-turn-helix transcriptional regulator [Diaminobutyricibacter tongyongensis]
MMPTAPTLLRQATVTPGAGAQNYAPAPSVRSIACENIRVACIWHDVRRKDLATMLGVSYDYAGRIINGKANLTVEHLYHVSNALKVPLERFLVEHDEHGWGWIYER